MRLLLFTLLFLTSCACLRAQSLLKDIKADNGSSYPRQMTDVNGTVFFVTKTYNNGETPELWKTNGTEAGTVLVKNPALSPTGPYFSISLQPFFHKFNDKLIFSANDAQLGFNTELWISDGTAAGTKMLKDINPGSGGSSPRNFVQLGAKFLFIAYTPANGEELWVSDGTPDGTKLCKDINNNANSSSIRGFTIFNGNAFFYAADPVNGVEMWKTDGTPEGTVVVTESQLNPGTASTVDFSTPLPVATPSYLYFPVQNSNFGKALFAYNTNNFLGMVYQNPFGDANPKDLTVFNDQVYFTANYSNIPSQRRLYKAEAFSAQNVVSVTANDPKDLTIANGKLFFTAEDGNARRELFQTDGYYYNSAMVKDINPSNTTGDVTFPTEPAKRIFIGTNSQLFFIANNGSSGYELWRSDGTEQGTILIKDFVSESGSADYSYFQLFDNELFFIANATGQGFKAWKTNGTLLGTQTVESINPALNITHVYPLQQSVGNFYFTAYAPASGYELYKLTEGSVSLVKDIKTGGVGNFQDLRKVIENNEGIFFTFDNGKDGLELWKTDGTQSGTRLFHDFNPYPLNPLSPYRQYSSFDFYSNSSYFDSEFTFYNNKLYFFANQKLWVTDGVNAPVIFKDFQTPSYNYKYNLIVYNNTLYFNLGDQLWKTNGTEAGTVMVKDIETGNSSVPLANFQVANNLLFFSGYDQTHGEELWRSDGTPGGTNIVKELQAGANVSNNSYRLQPVGNTLFFTFFDPVLGAELWKTNGTEAGTVMVKDIYPGVGFSPDYLTNFNNQYLVFACNDGVNGTELWKSDGIAAGTQMIKNLNPDGDSYPANNNQNSYAVFNNKVYFITSISGGNRKLTVSDLTAAGTFQLDVKTLLEVRATNYGLTFAGLFNQGPDGEPYFSDGTIQNTILLKDIAAGTASSAPSNFYHSTLRKVILFLASDGLTGREVHVVRDCPVQATVSGTLSGTTQVTAHKSITSTAKSAANSSTVFTAANSVLFTPGFEVSGGKTFTAQIGGCTYSTTGPAPLPGN